MMGYPGAEGIVPRASRKIFERIAASTNPDTTFKVEASMLEIYNEKVRDLFNPGGDNGRGLKVRDHPKKGPYVQNLKKIAVGSYAEIAEAMDAGTRARTVAATAMNATSSRAHTIFQTIVTQTTMDREAGKAMDKVSMISLIDLAGSERSDRTGASGDRLKEGCAINQSLSALGNVIFALAEKSTNAKKKNVVVPYRNSVLTHLLKNSLGGNAKTVMIAAISPSCVNYDETMSTLRYADRAKQIKNKAVVNEDPNQKLIRGLKDEIEQLKQLLASGVGQGGMARPGTAEVNRIREDVAENERLLKESEQSWEDRLKESQNTVQSNNAVLAQLGMTVDENKASKTPHMINLNQDSQMSGVLTYFFDDGLTKIGRKDAEEKQDIVFSGLSILKEHCTVATVGNKVTLEAGQGAKVFVNGKPVTSGVATDLKHTNRIVFGNNHVYLIVIPAQMETKTYDKAVRAELLQKYTWDDAMNELNESQISDLTEGERKAREKAEQEAREMQEKVKALEKRMEEERKRAEEETKAATDAEREKMIEKQKELQEALQAQIDQTNRRHARKEQERRKQAILEEHILRTLPLITEANAIAEELEKAKVFSIQLVATQNLAANPEVDNDEDELGIGFETTVWIKVLSSQPGEDETPHMWEYEKFINRLYLMREMYEEFVECNRDMKEVNEIYGDECDPFYDPDAEQLIGKAYVMLASLEYFIDIEDSPPIIQYQGKTDGALQVSITLDPEQVAEFDDLDTEEETTLSQILRKQLNVCISIFAAKGLPKRLSNNVAVSYKFFTNSHRTPPSKEYSINPRFDHVHKFSIPVTEDFISYIKKEPLEFQVWGTSAPVNDNVVDNEAALREGIRPCLKNGNDPESSEKPEEKFEPKNDKKKKKKKIVTIVDPRSPMHSAEVVPTDPEVVASREAAEEKVKELAASNHKVKQKAKSLENKLEKAKVQYLKLKEQSKSALSQKEEMERKVRELEEKLLLREQTLREVEEKAQMLETTIEMEKNTAKSSSTCIVS